MNPLATGALVALAIAQYPVAWPKFVTYGQPCPTFLTNLLRPKSAIRLNFLRHDDEKTFLN